MKSKQKLRLIINGVSLFTTVKNIQSGIGDSQRANRAAQQALDSLIRLRHADIKPVGISGYWYDYPIQIDLV